jgi:Na+/proline symporter
VIAGRIGIHAGTSGFPILEGLWAIVSYGFETNRFQICDLSLTWVRPYTIWAGIFGGIFVALATHGTDQLMVQRYLAARSLKEASLALALSGPLVAAQFALFLFLGVALAAYERWITGQTSVSPPDAALAYFVARELPAGISGLVIAAVLAAAMSTLSSSLSASASAAVNDFLLKLYPGFQADSERLLRISRIITLGFACVQTGVAFSGPYWTRTVVENVMAIATLTSGLTLGIFLLGVLCPQATQRAALWGFLVGWSADFFAVWVLQVSWPWYAAIGAWGVLLGGIATSWLDSMISRSRQKTSTLE